MSEMWGLGFPDSGAPKSPTSSLGHFEKGVRIECSLEERGEEPNPGTVGRPRKVTKF